MDRQQIALRLYKDQDERLRDILGLYESKVRQGVEHLTDGPDGIGGRHKVFADIGHTLLDYHVQDNYDRFSDLDQDFGHLGWSVGMLVDVHKDRGLVDEELAWLGKGGLHVGNSGMISFEPSRHLAQKPVICECEPIELLKLWHTYKSGQVAYFADQSEYGPSIGKILSKQQVH